MYSGQIVEVGDVGSVFETPRHPYTRALMKATPSGEEKQDRLKAITGRVPPPWAWPKGCRFHPRCEFAEDACQEKDIELINLSRCRLRDELDRTTSS